MASIIVILIVTRPRLLLGHCRCLPTRSIRTVSPPLARDPLTGKQGEGSLMRHWQASPARWWTVRAPAAVRRFGHLLWASSALPGSTHDLTTTRTHGIVRPTSWPADAVSRVFTGPLLAARLRSTARGASQGAVPLAERLGPGRRVGSPSGGEELGPITRSDQARWGAAQRSPRRSDPVEKPSGKAGGGLAGWQRTMTGRFLAARPPGDGRNSWPSRARRGPPR